MKKRQGDWRKKVFCLLLGLMVVFSQMGFAFAETGLNLSENPQIGQTEKPQAGGATQEAEQPQISEKPQGAETSAEEESRQMPQEKTADELLSVANQLAEANLPLILSNARMRMVYEGEQAAKMAESFVFTANAEAEGGGTWAWASYTPEGSEEAISYDTLTYYTIEASADWSALAACVGAGNTLAGKTVVLQTDLAVTESIPAVFAGTFDGSGKNMQLQITSSQELAGLFSTLTGRIKDLNLSGSIQVAEESSKCNGLGSAAGTAQNGAVIENVSSSVKLDGGSVASFAGGILGMAGATQTPRITRCRYDGTISNVKAGAGGISGAVPQAAGVIIRECISSAVFENCSKTAGILEAAAFSIAVIDGCLSRTDGLDITDGQLSGQGVVKNSIFLASNGAASAKGIPMTQADLDSARAAWILSGGSADSAWGMKDGKLAFLEDDMQKAVRVRVARTEEATDKTAKYTLSYENLAEQQNDLVAESVDGSLALYGIGNLHVKVVLTDSRESGAGKPLIFAQNAGTDAEIQLKEETEHELTYEIKTGSGDVEILYGSQLDKDNQTTTDWYDAAQEEFSIHTFGELKGFAELVDSGTSFAGKTVKLANDIVAPEDTLWTPIGIDSTKVFKGTFDGNHFTISGIHVKTSSTYAGFFAQIVEALIKNLTLTDGSIESTSTKSTNYAGGIAAYLDGSAIENCINHCDVKAKGYVGGIGGFLRDGSSITHCTNEGTITSTSTSIAGSGGICGTLQTNGTNRVSYSKNSGTIKGTSTNANAGTGGIAGIVSRNQTVESCLNLGSASGSKNNGAIAGYCNNGIITGCLSCTEGLKLAGKSGTTSVYKANYTVCETEDSEAAAKLTAGQLKSPALVADLNEAIGENFWGYGYEDETYTYPIFADCGQNPVYKIQLRALSGEPQVKAENSVAEENGTYYGKADLKLSVSAKGLQFMVFRSGSCTKAEDKVTVKAREAKDDIANVVIFCGTAEELDNTEVTEWYTSGQKEFTISTPGQLLGMATLVAEGNDFSGQTVTLADDIDLSGVCGKDLGTWKPIGYYGSSSAAKYFRGNFDGAGHTIRGLYGYKDASTADKNGKDRIGLTMGLFGAASGGSIQNLTVCGEIIWEAESAKFAAADGGVGGILGLNSKGDLTLKNLVNQVQITSKASCTGGIAGYIYQGAQAGGDTAIDQSFYASGLRNEAPVTYNGSKAAVYAGGLIGYLSGGSQGKGGLLLSCNTGTVKNAATGGFAGGLIGGYKAGYSYKGGKIYNMTDLTSCYNAGDVYGDTAAGVIAQFSGSGVNNDGSSGQPHASKVLNYGKIYGVKSAYGTINDSLSLRGLKPFANGSTNLYADGSAVYHTESLDDVSGAAVQEKLTNDVGEFLTREDFANGKLAYILDNGDTNQARANVWGQNTLSRYPEFKSALAPSVFCVKASAGEGGTLEKKNASVTILGEVSTAAGQRACYYAGTAGGTFSWIAKSDAGHLVDSVHAYAGTSREELQVSSKKIKAEGETAEQMELSFTLPLHDDVDFEVAFCAAPENLGEKLEVILDGNGGIWGKNTENKTKVLESTVGTRYQEVKEIQDPKTLKNGKYEFLGWYFDQACTQKVDLMKMMIPTTGEASITLYAGWDTASNYWQVSLDANGGAFPEGTELQEDGTVMLEVKGGRPAEIADSLTPAKEGFAFDGWFYDSELTQPYAGDGISQNTTLYAGYREVGKVTIRFQANGGYFVLNDRNASAYQVTVDAGTDVALSDLKLPTLRHEMRQGIGYIFAGWYDSTDPQAPQTAWSGAEKLGEDLVLYAKWTEASSFEDYLDYIRGQETQPGEIEKPSIIISDYETLKAFQKYVASGKSSADDVFSLGADITLPADWTNGISGFKGTFDGNGHTIHYDHAGSSLFGTVNGTVKNISVSGTATCSGGIAASMVAGGSIENCVVTAGTVLNGTSLGGIVGSIVKADGTPSTEYWIKNCRVEDGVQISGSDAYVGGIVGSVLTGSGTAVIEGCSVGKVKITGLGAVQPGVNPPSVKDPTAGSIGGLGGILGYGGAAISDCMSAAELEGTGVNTYGVGGIVGVIGTTQGKTTIDRCGFTGSITVENGNSIGGILGSDTYGGNPEERRTEIKDAYCTAEINVKGTGGGNIGGILGSNVTAKDNRIDNAYWNGKLTNPLPTFDAVTSDAKTRVSNTYFAEDGGFFSEREGATGKPNSAFVSGELAYELDKSHSPRGTWTQGETGPIFNKDGEAGIIYKVEVDKKQEIEWTDGTKAEITTTVSSELSEKAGLTDCDAVFVKNGEKVTTMVTGIPAAKVVKNSDGSTTTTNYEVKIKDKNGDQILFDSANPSADVKINKDLAANGNGNSSTATTGGGSGSGGGTGGGDGTGDKPGDGDGSGTGDGQGDGDQSGDGQGGQQGDGTGETGNKGDNPNGGTGTGTDVTPSVTPKPATAVPAKQQTTPQEIKEDPAASQASDDNDHEQIDQPESGGQSQGGGEQGEIQPESKIYKLIKSVTDTVRENPAASAAILIAVIGIIAFGAWNRKRKEDHSTKK